MYAPHQYAMSICPASKRGKVTTTAGPGQTPPNPHPIPKSADPTTSRRSTNRLVGIPQVSDHRGRGIAF